MAVSASLPAATARARRYEALAKIASGGTAAVWVGAPRGAAAPLVAIKRPHAHLADDPSFRKALVAEAVIASRVQHPNVVDVRDVEEDDDGIQLVMRYVEGASLSEMIRSWSREPPPRAAACALRIALDTCAGLAALHDLRDEAGRLLGVVHRDVSPANVLVGIDGVASITDFGLAKPLYAVERTTSEGALRGKLGYMAPEYVRGKDIDRRIDVFAMGVVVWEALAKKRLFRGENDAATLERVQRMSAPSLASVAPELGPAAGALDAVLARALAKDPEARTATAEALAHELEEVAHTFGLLATHEEVAASFGPTLQAELETRRARVRKGLEARASGAAPLSADVSGPRASVAPTVPPLRADAVEPTVKVPKPSRAAPVLVAIGLVSAVLAAGVVAWRRTPPVERTPTPAASAPIAPPPSAPPFTFPPEPPPGITVSAAPPAPPSSSPPAAPRARPAPRATASAVPAPSDVPGYKKPRPNPYDRP